MINRKHLKVIVLLSGMLLFVPNIASSLSNEIQIDRYITKMKSGMTSGDYQQALDAINQLKGLNIDLGVEILYFEAKALAETGKTLEAFDIINEYLEQAGREGDNYAAALELYDNIEPTALAPKKLKMLDEFVQIPAGCFIMGSNDTHKGYYRPNANRPAHEVCLKSFMISKYRVTNALWNAFMDKKKVARGKIDFALIEPKNVPKFLQKINQVTGMRFRLPSEAEYEYSLADSTETTYGDQPKPNSYGLYGMLENYAELVEDCWHPDFVGAPNDGSAWVTHCQRGYDIEESSGYALRGNHKRSRDDARAKFGFPLRLVHDVD